MDGIMQKVSRSAIELSPNGDQKQKRIWYSHPELNQMYFRRRFS